MTLTFPVTDSSRAAEVRRAATALIREEGLHRKLVDNVAVVATEICTNLVKFATRGEVFLSTLSGHGSPGIEILAIGSGPGMADVAQCLADGYSSAETAGTGLGAIGRLSTEFDIYSQPQRGTVLVARVQQAGFNKTILGAVLKPFPGEEKCGDAWAFYRGQEDMVLILADGLGHGPMAAQASAAAVSAFQYSRNMSPSAILDQVHKGLHGTRGAAVAVACADRSSSTVKYSGLGNISGVIIGSDKPTQMISHNGTAGFDSPRVQEFSYPFADETLLVMHSDGLHNVWNLDSYPGLRLHDPSIVAGVLYRDASRERDDVCVVVARLFDSATRGAS